MDQCKYSEVGAQKLAAGSRLEVILKLTERCNIACTYCYYFFAGQDSYLSRPPLMDDGVFGDVVKFLADANASYRLDSVQVDFHGGEPLLVKPARFDQMCSQIYAALERCPKVILALQTNAMLISDEWIGLFSKHRVHVGVSVDGPSAIHDRYRLDHKGNPTHAAVVKGVSKLKAAHEAGLVPNIAALCVLDAKADIELVYRHIVDELGIRHLNFLFPEIRGSGFSRETPSALVDNLRKLTSIWLKDISVDVRLFSTPYKKMISNVRHDEDIAYFQSLKTFVLTIYSNGEIGPDDALRPLTPELFETGLNVKDFHLEQVLSHTAMQRLTHESLSLPQSCVPCCWRNSCRAGEVSHRYSEDNRYDNPSVYCDLLTEMHATIAADIINRGVSLDVIATSLGLTREEWDQ